MSEVPPKQSAVILARVSSKSQEDEGYSLDSQEKLLLKYCDTNQLHVVRVFKIAETASKEQSRKVFHELLTYISGNDIQHLAVEKTDRFTRNFRDAVAIDDWLEADASRRLHAVKENLLLHKEALSDVKFMWNIHISVAKKYTDNLREEAMKGWAEKLSQGWLPTVPPPGYMTITRNGKRIHVPNPKISPLVELAFKHYLEPNHSIASIAMQMDMYGIRTRKGRPYVKSKVQNMLLNPFYIGVNRFNGKDYPGAQETFISKELFESVQAKLHRRSPSIYKKHNPIFKNIIRCEDCGTVVTWQCQKGRWYGVCRQTSALCRGRKLLREDRVEERLVELLGKLICPSEEIIEWVAQNMRQHNKTSTQRREEISHVIETDIERIKRMDSNLYDDKLSGDISNDTYKEKHEYFIEQLSELTKKQDAQKHSEGYDLEKTLVLLELTQKAAMLYQKKSPENKRLILSKLFENITLKEGSLSVRYTKFTQIIAQNVTLTKKIMEV